MPCRRHDNPCPSHRKRSRGNETMKGDIAIVKSRSFLYIKANGKLAKETLVSSIPAHPWNTYESQELHASGNIGYDPKNPVCRREGWSANNWMECQVVSHRSHSTALVLTCRGCYWKCSYHYPCGGLGDQRGVYASINHRNGAAAVVSWFAGLHDG